MKNFNNRENTPYKVYTGKDKSVIKKIEKDNKLVWGSRSVAIAATIMIQVKGKIYVLVGKRGPKSADFQGHWNLICGYLDWDETLQQATEREVWEEAGLDLDILKPHLKVDDLSFPWRVHSHPTANRQNVTNHFACIAKLNYFPKLSTEYNEVVGETEELIWMPIKELDERTYMKWAFDHDKVIKDYIKRTSTFWTKLKLLF